MALTSITPFRFGHTRQQGSEPILGTDVKDAITALSFSGGVLSIEKQTGLGSVTHSHFTLSSGGGTPTFPDAFETFVAVKETNDFVEADFSVSSMSVFLTLPVYTEARYVAVAYPREAHVLDYIELGFEGVNQFSSFTQLGSTIMINSIEYNVFVSNFRLTSLFSGMKIWLNREYRETPITTGGGGMGASTFEDLTDTPSSLGTALQYLRVDSTGALLEWADPPLGVPGPQGPAGNDGTVITANPGGTGLSSLTSIGIGGVNYAIEGMTGGGGASTFLDLTDTFNVYQALRYLRVNASANAIESVIIRSTSLDDVPNTYGQSQQILQVNSSRTALEWTNKPSSGANRFVDLTDTPSVLGTAGQVLQVNSSRSATEWVTPSEGGTSTFIDSTDTPSSYTDNAGSLVAVNSAASGVEFVNPLSAISITLTQAEFDALTEYDTSKLYFIVG